ncbi:short-chain fatty acid transporter [Paracoccus shanxieyensis]|uniref:Short-chain fatty acid transporter n=1 Tax=Paracoccus shanxieyensis TaxID=2675752 RepID=A0A6L6IW00_9RHOB|nr:short-chain fatty acid transporter [Paracoccus shanxieyensis]MTH64079.1 short-chain fatty acid transporter [Paracoccus shanxieyensis]MTH86880.1 short-chain fatty acid transporter [Paracoccus shanxieyensis]
MLNVISRPLVRLVDRWLPDPYIFVVILTLVVMVAAMGIEGHSPMAVVGMWGTGFWELLSFAMQMLLVLVTGYMMASTPLVRRILERLADLARTPGAAILLVSFVSLTASWINWGFGLVVGALFAKALARKVRVDYRLLVASAYSGFIVWHGGLAGSVPLAIATAGHPFEGVIGVIPTDRTIFAAYNLFIVIALFIAVPLVNRMMMPRPGEEVFVDPEKLAEPELTDTAATTPAERMENSRVLSWLIGAAGLAYLFQYFANSGTLTLNVVNFLFLIVAIVLHGTPRRLLASLNEGVKGGAGIVIQFPFYAGIMAIMLNSGLAETISIWLTSFATPDTFAFWTFMSAGLVNFFVPSGGGQWAIQAPVILPAAEALGVDAARAAMAVAWGDSWTNMVQPFWALPILGIAGLKARDIMGFCTLHLVLSGIIISIGLTFI